MNLSISRDGAEIGEWSEEVVRTLYARVELLPTDLYWKEGMSAWDTLGRFIKPPLPFPTPPAITEETSVPDVQPAFEPKALSPVTQSPLLIRSVSPLLSNVKKQRNLGQKLVKATSLDDPWIPLWIILAELLIGALIVAWLCIG